MAAAFGIATCQYISAYPYVGFTNHRLLLRDRRERDRRARYLRDDLRDARACLVYFLPLLLRGPKCPLRVKILTPSPRLFDAFALADLLRNTILPSGFLDSFPLVTPPGVCLAVPFQTILFDPVHCLKPSARHFFSLLEIFLRAPPDLKSCSRNDAMRFLY